MTRLPPIATTEIKEPPFSGWSSSPSSTKLSKLKSLSSQTSQSALATNLIIEVNIFGEHDVCSFEDACFDESE
ncbi:hypothetical protein TYRP_022119 [Tyrophagus putrescentiae]|nr:hypothetical protein TYRP_022119 [Tyrophagus putrescentiae]